MPDIAHLLVNPKYSDLTIVCQGVEFQVHRNIMCVIPYFDALCSGGFQEAQTRKCDLTDYHPGVVSRVISYVYTGDYDEDKVPKVFRGRFQDVELPPLAGTLRKQRELNGRVWEPRHAARVANRLQVNAMVYKLADMLGMRDLTNVASAACQDCLSDALRSDRFHTSLKTLFESTSDTDSLRFHIVFLLAKWNAISGPFTEEIIDLIMEYSEQPCKNFCSLLVKHEEYKLHTHLYRAEDTAAKLQKLCLTCRHGKIVSFSASKRDEDYCLWLEKWEKAKGIVVTFSCGTCREEVEDQESSSFESDYYYY